jgi:hypothetical protein
MLKRRPDMKSRGIFGIFLYIICIELSVLDAGDRVVRHLAAGEPWRAAEQPQLRQVLEDAPTLQFESLGEPVRGVNVWERWLAPYTQIVCGDKLYSSGYSGGHLFVYDPARPWTLSKGGPPGHPAPNQADARSNPRYLGDFDRTTRVGLMHSSALGADGRIYFGGFGLRHYTGGGFGWYDPKIRKMDGFWKPLSGYAVHWIAPALGGRLIIISTSTAADELNDNKAPEEAKLFVYDVGEQKIVREIVPIAKGRTTGLIAEVAPGRVLGLTMVTPVLSCESKNGGWFVSIRRMRACMSLGRSSSRVGRHS